MRGFCMLSVVGLFLSVGVSAETFSGEAVEVIDGDTIVVLSDGEEIIVRICGIDSPEKGQPYFGDAKRFTTSRCFGYVVRVRIVAFDDDGLIIGAVTLPDGRDLALLVIRTGLAWVSKEHEQYDCNCDGLGRVLYDARITKRGLWVEERPVAPWKYLLTYIKVLEMVPQDGPIRITNIDPAERVERITRDTTIETSSQTQEQVITEEHVSEESTETIVDDYGNVVRSATYDENGNLRLKLKGNYRPSQRWVTTYVPGETATRTARATGQPTYTDRSTTGYRSNNRTSYRPNYTTSYRPGRTTYSSPSSYRSSPRTTSRTTYTYTYVSR